MCVSMKTSNFALRDKHFLHKTLCPNMSVTQIVPWGPYTLAKLVVKITKPYNRQTQWFLITTYFPVGYIRNRNDVVG